jgi:hypothetical protein
MRPVLGGRALAKCGDDPDLYSDAEARKACVATAPITRASGARHSLKCSFGEVRITIDTRCLREPARSRLPIVG